MSVRPTLRIGPAVLGLALIAAACSSFSGARPAAPNDGSNGSSIPAATSPEPTFDLGSLLSPDPTPDATPAPSLAPSGAPQASAEPINPAPPPVSTTRATTLLTQVDNVLNEIDGELSNADAAANNPGE
jgi:hypothetical protein